MPDAIRKVDVGAKVVRAGAKAVDEVLHVLRSGGLVAFPTDTVYGLGALIRDERAIARLFRVKQRPGDKPIPVLLAGTEQVPQVAEPIGELARALARAFWPGPLTLILPRKRDLPERLGPGDSVGVRVPDHPFALELLSRAGPMAVTSANRSGQPSGRSAAEVQGQIGKEIELIVDGGRSPGGEPSTVVDCRDGEIQILRPGPISREDLQEARR